jgi:hypothetical protein
MGPRTLFLFVENMTTTYPFQFVIAIVGLGEVSRPVDIELVQFSNHTKGVGLQ